MSETHKTVIEWESNSGKPRRQEYEHEIADIRDFIGTAIYPYLVMAANRYLSAAKIDELLLQMSDTTPGTARSKSWVQRRMWMCRQPGEEIPADRDGSTGRTQKIMSENTFCSVRELVRILQKRGIVRSREWVRQHRVSG